VRALVHVGRLRVSGTSNTAPTFAGISPAWTLLSRPAAKGPFAERPSAGPFKSLNLKLNEAQGALFFGKQFQYSMQRSPLS
jgi:hypothetical protein